MLFGDFGVSYLGQSSETLSDSAFLGSKTYTYTSSASQNVSLTDLKDENGSNVTLAEGDYIVVTMERTSTSNLSSSTVSPTTGQGYTIAGTDLYANDTYDCNFAVNYKRMGATPDTNVTLPGTGGGGMSVTIFALRGIHASNPLDVAVTTATGTNSALPNPPSITPVTAGAQITVHGGGASEEVFTNPGDLDTATNRFRSAGILGATSGMSATGVGIKSDWSSGAFDPATWGGTTSTNRSWCAMTIAWRPA